MYIVYGYTDDCIDFSYTYDSFIKACKAFLKADYYGVAFISGVSNKVEQRLTHELWGKKL